MWSKITGSILEREREGGRKERKKRSIGSNRGGTPRRAAPCTGKERGKLALSSAAGRTDDLFRHATLLPFYMAVETIRGQWIYGPEAT